MNDFAKLAVWGQDDICFEYAKVAAGCVEEHENLYVTYHSPSGWFGRNSFLHPQQADIEGIIKNIVNAKKEGKPTLTAYAPEFQPSNIAQAMEKNGFTLFLTQTGMFFDLKNVPIPKEVCTDIVTLDTACVSNPEYSKIKNQTISAGRLHEWTEVMTEGFKPEKELEYYVYDNFAKSKNVVMYAYLQEGVIVGTSMLLLREYNSGIHEVAVPSAFRHQKIATKLITRILQDLKELGRTEVSLQASPFGYPVYKKIGFQETCHILTWKRE